MNGDERPNLHIPDETVQKVLNLLNQANESLKQASIISMQLAKDEALCTNCRLDAIQEETVINCAGFLVENLRTKLRGKLGGSGGLEELRGRGPLS